jgi:kumamolisin
MHRFGIVAGLAAFLLASVSGPADATAVDGIAAGIPRVVHHATYLGAVAPATAMRLVVHLAYPNPAAVDSFVRIVHDPASPTFGDFLGVDRFTAAFGPSAVTYSSVAATLRSAVLRTIGTYPDRKVLDVAGDAAHVQAAFHTLIGRFAAGGSTYYANITPARIPNALRGIVMAVSGFNDYDHQMPHMLIGKRGTKSFTGGAPPYGPYDIQTAYNEPIHVNPAYNGTTKLGGHATIAIETAYDYLDGDLQGYWTQFSVNRSQSAYVYRVFVDNPTGQGIFNPDLSIETTADVEQSTSNATGANVLVIEGVDNLTKTFDDVYANTVNDKRVDVVTTSWGLCEIDEDINEVLADNDLFKQGAAEGQTMFAASGDNGSKDCQDQNGQNTVTGVDFPSSSPWVGASGGTSLILNANSTIKSETGWSGSGGGISVIFPLPSYQVPVPTLGSTSGRNSPDVALEADLNEGYAFYYMGSGTLLKIGGTSLVAPNMAAMYGQFDGFYNKRLGLAANGLYVLFPKGTYPGNAFHDILSGSNGDYSAHAGYDNVTGTGSLNGYNYMKIIPHRTGAPL